MKSETNTGNQNVSFGLIFSGLIKLGHGSFLRAVAVLCRDRLRVLFTGRADRIATTLSSRQIEFRRLRTRQRVLHIIVVEHKFACHTRKM